MVAETSDVSVYRRGIWSSRCLVGERLSPLINVKKAPAAGRIVAELISSCTVVSRGLQWRAAASGPRGRSVQS